MQSVIHSYKDNDEPKNFDTAAIRTLRDIEAGPGTLRCTLFVAGQVRI